MFLCSAARAAEGPLPVALRLGLVLRLQQEAALLRQVEQDAGGFIAPQLAQRLGAQVAAVLGERGDHARRYVAVPTGGD